MAVTPIKKGAKPKPLGSSGVKKKQMSLMSFFKPQSSPSKGDSDKENDDSDVHSTPLTSETEPFVNTEKVLASSPLKAAIKPKSNSKSAAPNAAVSVEQFPGTGAAKAAKDVSKLETKTEINQQKQHKGTERTSDIDAEIASERKAKTLTSSPVSSNPKRRPGRANVSYAETDSEEDEELTTKRKRRKIIDSDDEAEDEYKAEEAEDDDDEMSDFIVPDDEDDDVAPENDISDVEYEIKPKKHAKKTPREASPRLPTTSSSNKTSSFLGNKFSANSSYSASGSTTKTPAKPSSTSTFSSPFATARKNFTKENEERYQWLVDIKDGEKRSIDHPEYDSRTLYVPSSAWAKFTNFEKQYWEIKSKMWDTVVFFKKGKFYELYENDAIIANTKFDLKIAGGGRANMKLAGIPEMSFEYWAKEFVSNGYKVAKVDQVETLLAKEMRGNVKEEKIIKRELTGILTGGTLTDLNMITSDMSVYCLSIKQVGKKFGLAFVDTSTSEMQLIEIEENDVDECSQLDTIITQIKPKEVIVEKNNLSTIPMKIIKHSAGGSCNIIWNNLNPEVEFWDYDTTCEELAKGKYYPAEDLDDISNYPEVLVKFKDEHHVAFNAFGGLLYYLRELKLDHSIMTMKNIHQYDTLKRNSTTNLLLDGITLSNLEILNNSFDGTDKGTLFKLMNRAITSFGKRNLKNWILNPLFKVTDINARFDAVEFLMNNSEFRDQLEKGLSGLPDLERLIARVHGKTLRFRDFVRVVEGFEKISSLVSILKSYELEQSSSGVLKSFVNGFPEQLEEAIEEWSDAFDREQALSDIIVPQEGIDAEFDDSQAKMKTLEQELGEYLKVYKKQYKSHEICFRDSGKEIFLIEVPTKIKNIPKDWQQMGSTSKVKRYWSPEVKKLVRQLMEQRELHKMLCESLRTRMYEKFDIHYKIWIHSIKSLAQLDSLVALTKTSESIGFPSCRPTFDEDNHGIIFTELRHPCFVGENFIPNDIVLGGPNGDANIGLLTGANAAGKSTLMRTTALAVILLQIGCFVPASEATLSPVDKIMTRLGANDNIMQGKSTFFVELSETKKILDNATPNSLVILDELGRGGSSSDGYAIAESVLYHLATHVQSLGFFATHYGTLGLSFKNHPKVKPLRMAIIVDEKISRNITFLYKLEAGSASGSFGMNVASMCGILEEIVLEAEIAAKEYEHTSKLKKMTESMMRDNNEGEMSLGLGLQSDFAWMSNDYAELQNSVAVSNERIKKNAIGSIFKMIEQL